MLWPLCKPLVWRCDHPRGLGEEDAQNLLHVSFARDPSWAVRLRKPLEAQRCPSGPPDLAPRFSGPPVGLTWSPSLPCCRHRYQGHVPGVAFSFGSSYGTTTLKYFQDHRNAVLERSRTPLSRGGHFPTIFSPNPNLVLSDRSRNRDRWLHTPASTWTIAALLTSPASTRWAPLPRPWGGVVAGSGETSYPPEHLHLLVQSPQASRAPGEFG